ncbi:MAG TPA: dihydroxyacetone kinase subunit DhaK, partial [Mycobacteriales bacterium]
MQRGCGADDLHAGVREGVDGLDRHLALVVGKREETRLLLTDAFEMGKEMAEADGLTIGTLIVDDDVAVKDSTYTVGRRGVAGNFFVIKAVGAAAEQDADLDELLRIGNKVNAVTRTMGMALTSCTPPAKGSPLFELGADEMEMGVGIHGEPGRRREKLASANEIVDELLEAVVSDLPFSS